jgi:DNA primase
MSDFIPQELIDQIRDANDIVDVISEYLPLRKRGKNYMGLCPFHPEKKPSFSVSPDKQVYHCFGCGEGGNVIGFLMAHEKVGFYEAIKTLAKRAGISLPKKTYDKEKLEKLDKLYYANQIANEYFTLCLNDKNLGTRARNYLERRGILEETKKLFSIGYAPSSWEGFLNYSKKKKIEEEILSSAGLIVEREGKRGYYDRFRNRIMFPVFNLSGKIVGFGGRVLDEKEEPKYLNSPETPIYQKGKLLYGLNFSKDIISDQKICVVVEGYMDLISLYQAGLKNVVASSGTAFTSDQARLIARFADRVYLLFDSDSAGMAAVLRSVDGLYDAGIEVLVVTLPLGEDPDSYVKKFGIKNVLEKLKQAKDFIDFKKESLPDNFSNLPIREQEKIILDFALTAKNIKDRLRQNLFVNKVSQALKINENLIRGGMEKVSKGLKEVSPGKEDLEPKGQAGVEMELLRILFEDEKFIPYVKDKINDDDFSSLEHQIIFKMLSEWIHSGKEFPEKKKSFSPAALIDYTDDKKIIEMISRIASLDLGPADLKLQLDDYLKRLKGLNRNKKIEFLKSEIKKALDANGFEKAQKLTIQLQGMIKAK